MAAKNSIPNCYIRGSGVYYLRYIYPVSLLNSIEGLSREFRMSLKTKEFFQAKRLSRVILNQLDDIVQVAEKMSPEEAKLFIDTETVKLLAKFSTSIENSISASESSLWNAYSELGSPPAQATQSKESPQAAHSNKTTQPKQSAKSKQPEYVTQAEYAIQAIKTKQAMQPTKHNEPVFSQVASLFLKEREMSGIWAGRTLHNRAAKIDNLIELVELVVGGIPFTEITTKDLAVIRDLLYVFPKNRKKMANVRNLSLGQIIQLPEESYAQLDAATANNYLSIIKGIFAFAVPRFHETNVAIGIEARSMPKAKRARARRFATVTPAKLSSLISSHIYTGTTKIPRTNYTTDKFWIPLIAMYSGARVGEILQLKVGDVVFSEEASCWYFDINDEDENKRLKTENSRRWVPVHSKLIELGFIEFCLSQGSASNTLFPHVTYVGKEDDSNSFSKWFERTLRKEIGWDSAKRETFHSFRHTFVDNLRREAGVPDWQIASVVGHLPSDEGLTTLRYGTHSITISDKRDIIEQVNYGIVTSHLSWGRYKENFL